MVFRHYISCKACKKITLLRVQVAHRDSQPIAIGCSCGVVLRGRFLQDNNPKDPKAALELQNADILKGDIENNQIIQEVESSGEFPVRKFVDGDKGEPRISPYIWVSSLMGLEKYPQFASRLGLFERSWGTKKAGFLTMTDLYFQENYEVLSRVLKSEFEITLKSNNADDVRSELYDVYSKMLLPIFPPSHFERTTGKVLQFFFERFKENPNRFNPFFDYLFDEIGLIQKEMDGFRLLNGFLEKYELFIPIFCLSHIDNSKLPRPCGSICRISTTDYEQIKQFYVDSFEWLSKILTIYVGIKNISQFGVFSVMPTSSYEKIKTLNDFYYSNNGIKKEFMTTSLFLDTYFSDKLENQLRNAIGHYKTRYDAAEQKIKYYPYNVSARADQFKEVFLIDFAEKIYKHLQAVYDALYVIGSIRTVAKR